MIIKLLCVAIIIMMQPCREYVESKFQNLGNIRYDSYKGSMVKCRTGILKYNIKATVCGDSGFSYVEGLEEMDYEMLGLNRERGTYKDPLNPRFQWTYIDNIFFVYKLR